MSEVGGRAAALAIAARAFAQYRATDEVATAEPPAATVTSTDVRFWLSSF
jgi:hypothetical protein